VGTETSSPSLQSHDGPFNQMSSQINVVSLVVCRYHAMITLGIPHDDIFILRLAYHSQPFQSHPVAYTDPSFHLVTPTVTPRIESTTRAVILPSHPTPHLIHTPLTSSRGIRDSGFKSHREESWLGGWSGQSRVYVERLGLGVGLGL
jgi:hypothetical protein